MKKKMTTTGDVKIALEEDLLTLDASTGEKFYRPFTPEDFRRFETETIHVREEAQWIIDEINRHIGNRRTALKYVFHVAQILSTSLDTYRQLVKDLRSKAYVTIYYIYDKKVEQMWQDQLKPTLGEIVALGEKIQTNLMDFTESCPASVFEKIVRASGPQEEPGMMPDDYEGLKTLAVKRMTESIRFVISIAEEIEMWITDLCGTRKKRSAPEETVIYRYLQKEFEETRQDAHLARVEKRHWHYLDDRKAEADMSMLQRLLDRTEEQYERYPICKLWADWGYPQEEETEAFAHELSQRAFGKEDFERLFMYQAEHHMLTEKISKRNAYENHSDSFFAPWLDPSKVEEFLKPWIMVNVKKQEQWYIVWCLMKYSFDMIRENQDKNDFAERMESMFKDVEVKCVVNSFRRQENKLNHNKHFSKWFKDTDPDYPIAESLFRKLKLKDRYRR
uniref:hypothetical protein n=1 Tax=Prevotella sp. TaxID=59823 RepID=UPI003FF0870C